MDASDRNKIDKALDVINVGYDYARRAFRKGVETSAAAFKRRMNEDLRSREQPNKRSRRRALIKQSGSEPPLRNRPFSFFDEYEVVCGVPVFTLDLPIVNNSKCEDHAAQVQTRSLRKKLTSTYLESYRHLNQRPSIAERGVELIENKISCHVFSYDDQLLVCGTRSGTLFVWDARRGHLLETLHGQHEFPIADVAFRQDEPKTLVSVDLSGTCVCWNLDHRNPPSKSMSFTSELAEEGLIGMESAVPCLSHDGHYVALPMFMFAETDLMAGDQEINKRSKEARLRELQRNSPTPAQNISTVPTVFVYVYVFEIKRVAFHLQSELLFNLPISVADRWTGAECMLDLVHFSRTSSALLFTVYELSRGFLVFWPNLKEMNSMSYKLEGTKGRFSHDDKYLVTWRAILSSSEDSEDSRCFVWKVGDITPLHATIDVADSCHPFETADFQIILTDPNKGVVHACDFLSLHEDLGLAVFSVNEFLHVVIWDLQKRIPVHILGSTVTRTDVFPGSYMNATEQTTRMEHTCGVHCFAVSRDGRWIGVYSSLAKQGIIWNANLGVEVFRMDYPNVKDEHRFMDFFFSEKSTNLILVSKSTILLWDAVILQSFNEAERAIYTLDTSQADLFGGEVSCKFSKCGNAIGLLPSYALSLDVWRLNPQQHYELNRYNVVHEFATNANRRHLQRRVDSEAGKYRFCRFAIAPDLQLVVTCMGDMSVLLWDVQDVTKCRRIATLTSEYFPALDVCFSETVEGAQTVVICQDQGVMVWIDLARETVFRRTLIKRLRRCKFSTNGKRGVLVLDLFRVEVIDLVEGTTQRQLTYPIPLFSRSWFPPILSSDGLCCLLGFDKNSAPVICRPDSKIKDLERLCQAPDYATLSEDGQWILMYGDICPDSNNVAMNHSVRLDIDSAQYIPGYPAAKFRTGFLSINTFKGRTREHNCSLMGITKGWKLVHINGTSKSKQIRMPFRMLPEAFIKISADGRHCAALNCRCELVVWGPDYTYNTIIHQREQFSGLLSGEVQNEEEFDEPFDRHGPGFLNYPYENGMTPAMECVQNKNKAVLTKILNWALEKEVKLALQGNITIPGTEIHFRNILDFALGTRVPDIAKMISNAMLDGVTTITGVCQIFEDTLISISCLYPAIALDLWRHKNALTPLCTVNVSEGYFKEQPLRTAVLTDKSNIASQEYIQEIWSGQEKNSFTDQPSMYEIKVAAEAKVFPYPDAAKIGAEGILQPLLLQNAEHQIFGADPVKSVINYKYETYGRALVLEDLYHYLLLLAVYTFLCIVIGYENNDIPSVGKHLNVAFVSSLVCLGYLIHFLKQVNALWTARGIRGLFHYISDLWKWLEFSSYILVVVVIPLTIRIRHEDSQLLDGVMATASVFLWTKLLYYAQAFKATGPMIVMIKEIAKDIKWFLFVLLIILVGFGIAFFVLMSGDSKRKEMGSDKEANEDGTESDNEGFYFLVGRRILIEICVVDKAWQFRHPWISTLSMFILMLSDVSEIVNLIIDNSALEPGTQVLAIIFMVIFLAAVAIILLNLMIAIMGDSFDRVKNHEQTLFLKRRAEVIQDMEMGLSESRRLKYNSRIAPYVHVLTPKYQRDLGHNNWEGRIVDVQRKMGEELRAIKEEGVNDFNELKRELAKIERMLQFMAHSGSGSNSKISNSEYESAERS